MGHDIYSRGKGTQEPDNTSPNLKASEEKHTDSNADCRNQTERSEVSMEPCLRLLQRVLTRPIRSLE